MKAYVLTTGMIFGLLLVVHVWRVIEEGPGLAKDPWFLLINLVAAGFCFWAWRVFKLIPRA